MRISGFNLAEFLRQASASPGTGNSQVKASVSRSARSSDPGFAAAKRVIDAEILAKSVTSPTALEQRGPTDVRLRSMSQPQTFNSLGDQRVVKYLETQFDADQSSASRFSLDTYA